jgi:hypothetical protein
MIAFDASCALCGLAALIPSIMSSLILSIMSLFHPRIKDDPNDDEVRNATFCAIYIYI